MSVALSLPVSPEKLRGQQGSLPTSCASMPPVLLGSICTKPGMQPKLSARAMKGSISVKPGMQPSNGATLNLHSPRLHHRSINVPQASPKLAERSIESPRLPPRDAAFQSQTFQTRRHSDTSTLMQKSLMQEMGSRPRGFSDSGLPRISPQFSGPLMETSRFASEDLHVGSSVDPVRDPSLKSEILAKLGLPKTSKVDRLSDNCGGLNQGVWIIQDSSRQQTLVLKLVSSQGKIGRSEAEKLIRLGHKFPSLATDEAVAFPIKIFSCVNSIGKRCHDFIVMRKVVGKPVGDVIAMKWNAGQQTAVMKMLRELGSFLAQFHKRYGGSQHCDFQPSNVFYDAPSGSFAMIDIADLGDQSCSEGDVKHFVESLRLLSGAYRESFYNDGKRNFEEGYKLCA